MTRAAVGKWRTQAQILLWKHGCAWPLAAVLMFAALAMGCAALIPARAEIEATRTSLAQAQLQPATTADAGSDDGRQLQAIRSVLGPAAEPAELIRKLSSLANAEHIVLAQAEYRHQAHPSTQVTQLVIVQPVRASYPQLRRYIETVLRSMPNASLDQIAARRDAVGQAQLDVRLRWSLWMQTPPPDTSVPATRRPATGKRT